MHLLKTSFSLTRRYIAWKFPYSCLINTKSQQENHLDDVGTTEKFVDRVFIELNGGRGGNGCVSFDELSPGKKRPSGGNGGNGGNVYLVSEKSLTTLNFQTFHFNAEDGRHGGADGRTGKSGADIFVTVPCGTLVTERYYDEETRSFMDSAVTELEEEEEDDLLEDVSPINATATSSDNDMNNKVSSSMKTTTNTTPNKKKKDDDNETLDPSVDVGTIDMDVEGMMVIVARGGRGGQGNKSIAGTKNRRTMSMPKTKIPGQPGQSRSLVLELKLIADVGLVGFPNAGKSTLLRALSNAKPKVAPYPFTTLTPTIGIVEYSDGKRLSVADIPGLIEGAHMDRGLGHEFLRHIERTKVLLLVLDGAGSEGREPSHDLLCLLNELKLYDPELAQRATLVFANKSDLEAKPGVARRLRMTAKEKNLELLTGCAMTGADGIDVLAKRLREILELAGPPMK